MSGEIAAGKTAVATELEARCGFKRIRSGSYLAEHAKARGLEADRYGLQKMGDLLDEETNGSWIAELARDQVAESQHVGNWVLDSVRRDFQVSRFREVFGGDVIHVHLLAAKSVLGARFHARSAGDDRDSGKNYATVKSSETEKHSKGLGAIADIAANSGTFTPIQIAQLIDLAVRFRSEGAEHEADRSH